MGDELKEEFKLTLELLRDSMKRSDETIKMLIEDNRELKKEIKEINSKFETVIPKQTNSRNKLKEEVDKKFKKKKKGLIKNKIIETANTIPCSLPELKERIVDEMEYCSKASFYRYISEIVKEGQIQIAGERVIAIIR